MQYQGSKIVGLTYNQNAIIWKRIWNNYNTLMFHCHGQVSKAWNHHILLYLVALVTMQTTNFWQISLISQFRDQIIEVGWRKLTFIYSDTWALWGSTRSKTEWYAHGKLSVSQGYLNRYEKLSLSKQKYRTDCQVDYVSKTTVTSRPTDHKKYFS